MSARNSPWPAPTPDSSSSRPPKRSLKRRRSFGEPTATTSELSTRQVVADQPEIDQALTNCQIYSGNNVISCYPNSNAVIAQHQWTSFVWNSRRPELTNTATDAVDVYLFHGDSQTPILYWPNLPNPNDQAGRINVQVNDSWWGANGAKWNGQNISYPFYWVIISNTTTLNGNQIPQPTFTAVQTTYADSVIAASSASAASAASASASSASASLTATYNSPSSATASPGHVQSAASSSGFPHWAIAVIVVLGFLAIVASCVLAFFLVRRARRRELITNRSSMGSASPMMANVGGPSPGSPLLVSAAIKRQPSSVVGATQSQDHDGASTISRTGSANPEAPPFSGADAAIMADAFRKMLRKPDFADRPVEEGESPDRPEPSTEMIGRELAEEGRDIRSVRSERGVRVETLSDGGDTAQDPHGSAD